VFRHEEIDALPKRHWRYPVGVGAAATGLIALLVFVGVQWSTTPPEAQALERLPAAGVPAAESSGSSADWIAQSDANARILLDVAARYTPESVVSVGVEGHDEAIMDLGPRVRERREADLRAAIERLEAARGRTNDRRVQQDLDILIVAAQDDIASSKLAVDALVPFFDLPQTLYFGFRDLLDARIAAARHPAALVRLARYVGRAGAHAPITELAKARFEERAGDATLLGPWIKEVEQTLSNQSRYVDGIESLLAKSGLDGWQADFALLRGQLDDYADWVRAVVLPRARPDHRLPRALYENALVNAGVRTDPQSLMDAALASYVETRTEMTALAATIATARGFADRDYPSVLRALKRERIPQDRLLDLYRARLRAIEDIVRRERIVTLPAREALIRLATEAESAATPAPHLDTPRLIGNTGEQAAFVLPVTNPNASSDAPMDDFDYDAIAWTLTAHEARPGHELQFSAMLEQGVSVARSVYAFNSANVEGWALYAEAQMQPYLPPEGQLGTLQLRLMRAARAFLDPMLNLGLIDVATAKALLMNEVGLSEPMAQQEVDRYTFVAPGQATAYFYGYTRLNALRAKAEIALGTRFDILAYHDFVVRQGVLPFDVLERAVMEEFAAPR
jgi:hypothetical protein